VLRRHFVVGGKAVGKALKESRHVAFLEFVIVVPRQYCACAWVVFLCEHMGFDACNVIQGWVVSKLLGRFAVAVKVIFEFRLGHVVLFGLSCLSIAISVMQI
jgi:hypothetical protein